MTKNRNDRSGAAGGKEWILVGIDFSLPARQALLKARSVARERDCALLVLHVIDAHGLDEVARIAEISEEKLRHRLARERREGLARFLAEADDGRESVVTELMIAWGRPFEEILRKASDLSVDLIVLGTAGRSADLERALFGSTAEKVLRAAPCPVLCVPSE
jgi:nucleotide-binding universal stress UspA family protein